MDDLFTKCNSDLLHVSWAHAVNSEISLISNLKSNINCIESDVTYCFDDQKAYISHPPIYKSDLQFDDYWKICKSTDKWIKLDFKMIEAVEFCLQLFQEDQINNLIFNADILKSSVSNQEPVDSNRFIELCSKYAPKVALSIGWTTVKDSTMGYTWSDVFNMNAVIHKIIKEYKDPNHIITIPVDVHMTSLNSIPKLLFILDQFDERKISLTLWSYADAKIDVTAIKTLRKALGKSSILLDVPQLLDSEREEILSVRPNSDPIQTIICSSVVGSNLWSSRSSLVIGADTSLTLERDLSDCLGFFIIFDNSNCEGEHAKSNCGVQLKYQGHVFDMVSLTKRQIISDDKIQSSGDDLEMVYFVSIDKISSSLTLTVFSARNYNTSDMEMTRLFIKEVNIEEHGDCSFKLNISHCDTFSRFIAVNFCDKCR